MIVAERGSYRFVFRWYTEYESAHTKQIRGDESQYCGLLEALRDGVTPLLVCFRSRARRAFREVVTTS